MTDEDRQKLDDIHRWLMGPREPGKRSRAEDLDEVLATVRAGKLGARALLWIAGLVVALAAAWGALKGWVTR